MFNIHAAAALAAAAGSPAPQKQEPAARGRMVSGPSVVYVVDKLPPSEAPVDLPVQPITKMRIDYTQEHTRVIAVNNDYITYGLKTGAIRVLKRDDGSRSLFKTSTTGLTDLAFYSFKGKQLLASVSNKGELVVQEVMQQASDGSDAVPEGTVYMRSKLPGGFLRLTWHPITPQILAASSGNTLHLFEVPADAPGGEPEASEPGMDIRLPSRGATVTALSFSLSGRLLAAGDSSGLVSLWHLEDDSNPDLPAESPRVTWSPHGSGAVSVVYFLQSADTSSSTSSSSSSSDDCILLTADATGRRLALWSLSCPAGTTWAAPVCCQRVEFSSAKGAADFFNHITLVPSLQLVVAANSVRKEVYTLHYAPSSSSSSSGEPGLQMDYVATFSVAHPILSITSTIEKVDTPPDADGGTSTKEELWLYTVQTEAIQQYTLDPALCQPPRGAAAAASIRQPALEEAEEEEASSGGPASPPAGTAPAVPAISPSMFLAQRSAHSAAAAAASPPTSSLSSSAAGKRQEEVVNGVGNSHSSPAAAAGGGGSGPGAHNSSSSMQPPAMPPMPSSMLSKQASLQQEDKVSLEPKAFAIDAAGSDSETSSTSPPPAAAAAAGGSRGGHTASSAAATSSVGAAAVAVAGAGVAGAELEALRQQLARLTAAQEALVAEVAASRAAVKADVEAVVSGGLKAQEAAFTRSMEGLMKAGAKKDVEERRKAAVRDKQDLEKSFNAAVRANNSVLLSEMRATGLEQASHAMTGALAEALPAVTSAVTSSVAVTLKQSLPAALSSELGAAAVPLAAAVERAVVPAVSAALGRQLQEALASSFKTSVIPGFERATQVMFSQIEQAFTAWLADSSQLLTSTTGEAAAPLGAAVTSLQGLVSSLRAEVLEGQRQLTRMASSSAASAASGAGGRGAGGGEGSQALSVSQLEAQALDPKVHIAKLLAAKRYEDGFYAALNSSSLEVLMWAARQVDASVLSTGPNGSSVLSQTVLLSLLHQLASELRTDTALKLEWLAEVVPLINGRDPLIAGHIKGVAKAVMAALKELIAGLPTTDPLAKQAKPVLHLLNPLLMD